MVYYRKYRPQTIAELDLESIRERLTSILSAKDLPHAFLFTGPKGLGKTSSARILAKAINCESNDLGSSVLNLGKTKKDPPTTKNQEPRANIEPCNKCEACISITNGSNLDVIEIDAASNRGIDEIRDLREKIKFSPARLRKKVYIIDEVHMLTTDAFNALLKTLEEPPDHAIFILCTTEAEKVPPTIISRTFHVQFHLPSQNEIVHSLERIIKGEKLEVSEEVLYEIFKLSESSFRDAAKVLEDLAISSKGKITIEVLNSTYRVSGIYINLQKLLLKISKKDVKAALSVINELTQTGADFKIVTERLALALHDMLSGRNPFPEGEKPEFDQEELKTLLKMVNDSYKDIKFSVLPQIPLELVVVDWCLEGINKTQNEEKKEFLEKDKSQNVENQKVDLKIEESIIDSRSIVQKKEDEDTKGKSTNNHGEMFEENSKSTNFFLALISKVKADNHTIAGILRGCKLSEIRDGEVLFETKYKFHKDRLSDSKVRSILDKRASEILQEDVRVIVNLAGQ